MIISQARTIRTNDIPKFAWSSISYFQNVDHTARLIVRLHKLSGKDVQNAKRQAEQVKYCLAQAKEYFDAARHVSLATRPVLLYYSAMSMALAEILVKQTADSRLSALREKHNCHGLQLVVKAIPKTTDSLNDAAANLLAKAQGDSQGNPKGTFEVWRRSAREHPIGGYHTETFSNGTNQKGFQVVMGAADIPPPALPTVGISLLDCMANLPSMRDVLHHLGAKLEMVRARVATHHAEGAETMLLTVIVHPNDPALIDKFGNLVVTHAAAVNFIEVREMPTGYVLRETIGAGTDNIREWPQAICLTNEDVYFSCCKHNLGEFGYLYVALHICGNFARYYPEWWLRHIEESSSFSMAIDELCSHAIDRLPLSALSELSRVYHVVEA